MENGRDILINKLKKDPSRKDIVPFVEKILDSKVSKYLKSGLSRKDNYDKTLTPEIFLKYFYVERKDSNEKDELGIIKENINKLFENHAYNVMAIRSFRGSGKSVFVNILAHTYSDEYKIIKVDLEQGEYEYENTILFSNIMFELKSFIEKEIYKTNIYQDDRYSKIYQKLIEQISHQERITRKFFVVDDKYYLEEIWDKFNTGNQAENNTYYTYDVYDAPARKKFITDTEINENSAKRKAVIYFYLVLTISAMLSKELYNNGYSIKNLRISGNDLRQAISNKYLFIFDNIEAYNMNRADTVYQFIKNIHLALQKTFEYLEIEELFFTKFECIIALRTRTAIALYDQQRADENIIFKAYDLGTPDIFDSVLLAKYKFLYDLDYISQGWLRSTQLYSSVEHICRFFFPKAEIDKYLKNNEGLVENKKVFITKKFAPFFAYDFRRMSKEVATVLDSSNQYSERVKFLLDSNNPEGINGARMILFRLVFDDFVHEGVFNAFGFSQLDGKKTHSISRSILLYLFYNRQEKISLEELLRVFVRIYKDKPREFSNSFWCLSQFNDKSENTTIPPIEIWGNLLEFKNAKKTISESSLFDLVEHFFKKPSSAYQLNEKKIADIEVNITETGKCFISYISKQFEFFASRSLTTHSALFAFEITNKDSVDNVVSYINDMYMAIKAYATAMIRNGKKICQYFGGKLKSNCPIGKSVVQNERHCSFFQRAQEVWGLLKEIINYIDRYRLFVIYEIKNQTEIESPLELIKYFNEKILNEIKKFSNLLSEQRAYALQMNCSSPISNLVKVNLPKIVAPSPYDVYKNTNKVKELDDFDEDRNLAALTNYEVYTSAYYFYAQKKESIEDAITKCLSEQQMEKSIYNICKEMALQTSKVK